MAIDVLLPPVYSIYGRYLYRIDNLHARKSQYARRIAAPLDYTGEEHIVRKG